MVRCDSHTDDDVTFVESRREPRIILSIPARYTLANQRDAGGNRREFFGRLVNISLHAMALVAPVIGDLGEPVTTHSDEFGTLEGSIMRVLDQGFVMAIETSADVRAMLEFKD